MCGKVTYRIDGGCHGGVVDCWGIGEIVRSSRGGGLGLDTKDVGTVLEGSSILVGVYLARQKMGLVNIKYLVPTEFVRERVMSVEQWASTYE